MAVVEWLMGVYDRAGVSYDSTSFDGSVTDEYLKHFTNASLTIPLNGIDTLTFSLLLTDPAAQLIGMKNTVIRLWRNINDTVHSKTRTPPEGTPDFCGIVTGIDIDGEGGTVTYTVQGILWLVQTHFHLNNHRSVNDPSSYGGIHYEGANANDLPFDESAMMFRLIDLINGAFKNTGGDTGIRKPLTRAYTGHGYLTGESLYWPQTIRVDPFYNTKGDYTWPLITDLLGRDASPDLTPEYIWNPGGVETMYFKTALVRGTDISDTFSFDYRTGSKNVENVTSSAQVVPGEYADWIWVSGDGGPNGGYLSQKEDDDVQAEFGIFMSHENIPGNKKADIEQYATAKLKKATQADAPFYQVSLTPASPIYYGIDFEVGDRVTLNADKGALLISGIKQRIYKATLSYSDNNVETCSLEISADFKRKYPE